MQVRDLCLLFALCVLSSNLLAQEERSTQTAGSSARTGQTEDRRSSVGQRSDGSFKPKLERARFEFGTGPKVAIDEQHRNFHTLQGRFRPFGDLLEADGYQVQRFLQALSLSALNEIDVLVIANASGSTAPSESAFSAEEIDILLEWIRGGGRLLLLADHRPYGEAAQLLGKALGVEMSGGFVVDEDEPGPIVFALANQQLLEHPITLGSGVAQPIPQVVSFTGQALRFSNEFQPLMRFDAGTICLSDRPRSRPTPSRKNVTDWFQGGVAQISDGRVAVFGEAGMFSAQISVAGNPMGMNAPAAESNQQFLLNVMAWLTGNL